MAHQAPGCDYFLLQPMVRLGTVIHRALDQQREAMLLSKSTLELEKEIARVQDTQERLLKLDRISLVRKYDVSLTELRTHVEEKEERTSEASSRIAIWNTLGTLLFFRLLVMGSNFCCLQLLKPRLRLWQRKN